MTVSLIKVATDQKPVVLVKVATAGVPGPPGPPGPAGSGGGIEEAPLSGGPYARQAESWTPMVPVPEVVTEAPIDGKSYSRTDADWTETNHLVRTGDTMQGPLFLYDDPQQPLEAATKQYVDASITTGAQGPQGEQGIQGTQGPAGPAGQDGLQGPAGPVGPQGPQGIPGTDGQHGAQGADGIQGPQGPAGAQGDVGPQGPQGDVGPQGLPGPSSSVWGYTYSNVATAPPSSQQIRFDNANTQLATKCWLDNRDLDGIDISNYLALIRAGDQLYTQDKNDATVNDYYDVTADAVAKGTYYEFAVTWTHGSPTRLLNNQASVVSLLRTGNVGPMGPQGPQGPAGDVGAQGPQGIQGPTGAQGAKGDTGATGAQGAQGIAGIPGVTGPQGIQGPPGPTAVSADANNTATLGTDGKVFVPLAPAAGNAVPQMDGKGAAGTATSWSRVDHVHPTDTSRLAKVGVVDGSNAAAGEIGEFIIASNSTGIAATTGVPVNVASIQLTPGDWRIRGVVAFIEAANTVPTVIIAATSLASATLPTLASVMAGGGGSMSQLCMTFTKGVTQILETGQDRINVTANTTVWLVAQSTFGGGTMSAQGNISARRMR